MENINIINTKAVEEYISFYEKELKCNVLPFWLKNCEDKVNGGYFNCFDNAGKNLISHDKYTWSQGRFLWIWVKLAESPSDIFTTEERAGFLKLADSGAEFLKKHVLAFPGKNFNCAFLCDEEGRIKISEGESVPDSSIYADCFAVNGLAAYAAARNDKEAYELAVNIFKSCIDRIASGVYYTQPYPIPQGMRAHGIPMIMCNVCMEMIRASEVMDSTYVPFLRTYLKELKDDILNNFTDGEFRIHEFIYADGSIPENLLGQHCNPGHCIEDMWFINEACEELGEEEDIAKAANIVKKELQIGWDEEYGGILHYCGLNGGFPDADTSGVSEDPMVKLVGRSWGDKLWWVHSEALYTTLLYYLKTGDAEFYRWHLKVKEYVFTHFPNPDKSVGEWIQILNRDGSPDDKVVALPVKDPYHIMRNLILISELRKYI